MLASFAGIERPDPAGDSRIRTLLDLIPSIPDKKAPVGALAARVGISETRLMHLFKDEMGIPIRRYLLWKRLLDAIFLIKRGQALTMAAVEAGFADYAHFSRTFKGMFGAKVEDIFKNDRFVQAYVREK
jgi:AraC-like DNA-binding protein